MRCGQCGCPVIKVNEYTLNGIEMVLTKCTICSRQKPVLKSIWEHNKKPEEHSPYCTCEECRAGHMEDTSVADRARRG